MRHFAAALIVSSLVWATCSAHAARPEAVPVAGWLELARLSPGEIVLEAKLDSGARTSSLHAVNLQHYEHDGKAWVSFDVVGADGRSARIERPVVRTARVKSALGSDEARPTITLGVCVGPVYRVTEISLVDREGLPQPLLIGRRFLRGRLLVDVGRRHLLRPDCK